MDFSRFSEQVVKIKNLPLPGAASHYKMEPELRKQLRQSSHSQLDRAKKAAVMALFYPKENNETHLLLLLRNEYPGVHSNQIGLPGGKVEKNDVDLLHTAKRETFEEVGVKPEAIEMLKAMTQVYIPPSNFLVQPFVGLYAQPEPFVVDVNEVAQLVEVKLVDFLEEANVREQRLSTSYAHDILVPAYELNGYTVWGATAMMLSEIKDLILKLL